MSTTGLYCDGETIRSVPVEVEWQPDGAVQILKSGESWRIDSRDYTITDRLGSVPRFLHLKNGGMIELPVTRETGGSNVTKTSSLAAAIHWLESRSSVAAVSLVLVVLMVALGMWQGAPRLARRAAFAAPVNIEQHAGEVALSVFTSSFRRTNLEYYEQRHVQQQLDRLTTVRKPHVAPKLVFLAMGTANAFALPGGTIVVADELVNLAENDDEIAAVLAHELGHIENRHGLQSVLRNSTALIVVSSVTGDLSTLSTFSATLPFLLLQYGYAREFETEADRFATELLKEAQIDPTNLASILDALGQARPQKGPDFSYLSTHPSTSERIKALGGTPARSPRKKGEQSATQAAIKALAAEPDDKKEADFSFIPPTTVTQPKPAPGPVSSSGLVQPRRIFSAPPLYPHELRAANVTGEALIEFIVLADGSVANVKVVRATHPPFGTAAADAVSKWVFEPGRVGGKAVNTRMQQPITFSLQSETTAETNPAAIVPRVESPISEETTGDSSPD